MSRAPTRLSDIATALSIDLGTAHRIVKGLCFEGALKRDAETRRYRLGHLMHELGVTAAKVFPLRDICRAALDRLAGLTGDSVFLLVRSDHDVVCLDHVAGTFPIQAHALEVGARRPLGIGAGGLAILSALPDGEVDAVLHANAHRYAAWPGMSATRVRELVAQSRTIGFALNVEELMSDVVAIGLAFDAIGVARVPEGPATASISIASVASRMTPARRVELAEAAREELRQLTVERRP